MMNKNYHLSPLICILVTLLAPLSTSYAANGYGRTNQTKATHKVVNVQKSPRSQHAPKAVLVKRPGISNPQPQHTKRTIVKKTTPLTIVKHHRTANRITKTHTTKDVVYPKKNISIHLPAKSKPTAHNTKIKSVKKIGKKYRVRGKTYYILPTSKGYHEKGTASWYGKPFHGRKTANGETYNMHKLSAAHKSLPLNSTVKVKNLKNNKEITLKINDRGPFKGSRVIDLSYAAAKKLGMVEQGLAKVEIKAIG